MHRQLVAMDIVACTDTDYIMQTGIMMYSVCVNNINSSITFHIIIDEGVSAIQKDMLQKTLSSFTDKSIVFYRVDSDKYSILPKRPDLPTITQATYYRLDLANIIPPEIDKVLYLDGDIICRKPLDNLWNTDISQFAVAGVHDVWEEIYEKSNHLHLSPWRGYFNAGVLLINLKWWRENNSTESFYAFIDQHGDWLKCQDQDVLNYVFNEHKLILPIKYNLATDFLYNNTDYKHYSDQLEEAIHDPVLIHFIAVKPWQKSCRHPYRSTFLKYKSQTIWRDEPLQEDRPLSLRIRIAIGKVLRFFHLLPKLPPVGMEFLPYIRPLD